MKERIILLIDADADCGAPVLEAASRTGHVVHLSRNGREARASLERNFDRIDGLLIDLDPGPDGVRVLAELGALRYRPPVIVLTALEESHVQPLAERHGALECLGKPLSIERLRSLVARLAREKRAGEISSDLWGHPRGEGEEVLANGNFR